MYRSLLFYITLIVLIITIAWDKYIYQRFLALSSVFNYSAEIVSLDNFYDAEKEKFSGEVNSVTRFSYKVVAETDTTLTVQNTFDVKTVYSEPIFSVTRLYGIDKVSQKHTTGVGDEDRDGYLFAPRNLKKGQPFTYWHVNYDGPAHMKYVKEEKIEGLVVYRYESDYSDVTIDQTQQLTNLPGVPEEMGVRVEPKLTVWIEPVSGWMVHYQDQTDAYFYDVKTGEKIVPWNSFRNFYTENSISQQVIIAKNLRSNVLLLHYGVPALLVILWLACFLVLYFGKSFTTSFLLRSLTLFLLIVLMALLTFGTWWYTRLQSGQIYNFTIAASKQDIQDRILDRMSIYTNALTGTKGLFNASDEVTRDEWKSYTLTMNLQQQYPGIGGLGYAKIIDTSDIPIIENKISKEGYPEFKIFPLSEREKYSAIIYLEPLDERNQRAFGYDMFSERVRAKAMDLAAQTDMPVLSGKVTLIQELDTDTQPGILMYLSIIEHGKLTGYVYSPFRMYDLMEKMFSPEDLKNLSFKIYDASETDTVNETNLLFDSEKAFASSSEKEEKNYKWLGRSSILLYNSKWVIEFFAAEGTPLYTDNTFLSNIILIFGTIITVLLLLFFVLTMVGQINSQNYTTRLVTSFGNEKNELLHSIQSLKAEKLQLLETQKNIVQEITQRKQTEVFRTQLTNFIFAQVQRPVGTLRGLLNTFLSGKIDNLDQRQYRTILDVEAVMEDMTDIISHFSSIIKLESGELTTELRIFHPKDLVRLVVSSFSKRIKEKSIGISVEITERVVPFISDVHLLNEVLSIVLANSIKYSSHLTNILIKVDSNVESTTFTITDTGRGISEAEKKHVFERFSGEKTQINQSGTGLSLYYAKKVVEILGGTIILDSVVGKGTTVAIILPKKMA